MDSLRLNCPCGFEIISAMETDVVIIGAGVVGCSVARELSRYNVNVSVLEAGSDVAEGASKANSAIVHAGFDAKPGTNKAKFNVAGNRMFEDVCRELKVPFRRNGSMVLAFGAEDERSLADLVVRAEANGVPVEIISPRLCHFADVLLPLAR